MKIKFIDISSIILLISAQTYAFCYNNLFSRNRKNLNEYAFTNVKMTTNSFDSAIGLGINNFKREYNALMKAIFVDVNSFNNMPECLEFKLSNDLVKQSEINRNLKEKVSAHPIAKLLYDFGCNSIDLFFSEDRPIARFWLLETIARIPYFSYVSMLHLYETLGWWRQSSLRKVHFAEEWNELHHLLIMESLGGNKIWLDRFCGYHLAIVYYWLIVVTYLVSPKTAYQFSELLEIHAEESYAVFLEQNAEILRNIPAPDIAVSYYTTGDLYEFDDFQIDRPPGSRRPPCDNLYDVFRNIRDDEAEHVTTMKACQNYSTLGKVVVSPHERYANNIDTLENVVITRSKWVEWSNNINKMKTPKV